MTEEIKEAVARAPTSAGCYIWKDESGEILYVGKAIQLRSRLKSYLRPEADKTVLLMQRAHSLEWISTDTGREALILEATLVKKFQPRFNVRLKDDKRYPWICVSSSEMYPQAFITRHPKRSGDHYYGPYTDVRATRNTLALIHKIFPIRKVRQTLPQPKPKRPCMNFHIGRCLGPCQGNVDPEEYGKLVEQIRLFLEGRTEILETLVVRRMEEAAAALQYEQAAMFRDILANIRRATERQIVVGPGSSDEDVLAFARRGDDGQIVVFEMREGKLAGRKSFPLKGVEDTALEEVFASFVRDYYLPASLRPARILIEVAPEGKRELEESMEQGGRASKISKPRDEFKRLAKLAARNAELLLRERLLAAKSKDQKAALVQVQEMFSLPASPRIMECYDISHLQGTETIAAGVRFVEGQPSNKDYRTYRIRTVQGIDDPASIAEAIARRLQRLLAEDSALPDLIVIDGGFTQLSAACETAAALGAGALPMVGLAKQREEIYFPGEQTPRYFDPESAGMRLLRHMRDEAHRFGITAHRKSRNRLLLRHAALAVPDIGPGRLKALLKNLDSKSIDQASEEELARVPGIGPALARKLRTHFGASRNEGDG